MAGIPNDGLNRKATPQSPRTIAFICYSRKDQQYLQELREHLAYYIGKWNLEIWDDTKIRPGANRREEINKALRSAKIGILLLSANFFASQDIVENELPQLLDAAREEGTIILCVILRACPFEDTELAHFQAVNDPSTPLNTMSQSQRDTIWQQVAEFVWKTLSQESEGVASKPTDSQKSPAAKIQPTNTRATSNDPPDCDICVICAMREEVEAFMHEAERLCQVTFQPVLGPRTRRDYRYTTIRENLSISM